MESKNIRQLHLHTKRVDRLKLIQGSRKLPWLNLSGIWLEQAGFMAGGEIEVTVTPGRLVIKTVE